MSSGINRQENGINRLLEEAAAESRRMSLAIQKIAGTTSCKGVQIHGMNPKEIHIQKEYDSIYGNPKDQYGFALNRIEELLPLMTDETPSDDKNAVELTLVSDVVEAYEKDYYLISKPTIGQLIGFYLEKLGVSKKELTMSIGVSQSRVSDYISGTHKI